jgi:uncharacterized membrane protein
VVLQLKDYLSKAISTRAGEEQKMSRGRLEAFSDGVLAIIITIMVLGFKIPEKPELSELRPLVGPFLGYVLSFLYVGIYWNNHHHLFSAVERVSGSVLWANLHLLFWLSLVPFATGWMTVTNYALWPVVIYGIPLVGAAMAYYILTLCLLKTQPKDSPLIDALRSRGKEHISLALYVISLFSALWQPWTACVGYFLVALIWLVPDRRIERQLK